MSNESYNRCFHSIGSVYKRRSYGGRGEMNISTALYACKHCSNVTVDRERHHRQCNMRPVKCHTNQPESSS